MKDMPLIENIFRWNRKVHIYIGLFLLFFILFFSFSGLLLNHSQWKFTSFWKERRETTAETPVTIPANPDSASLIRDFTRQLNISAEISNVRLTAESIYFRAAKPGLIEDINVNLKTCVCVRKEIVFNWWGKIRNLHTFNGSDKARPEIKPNWYVSNIWRLAMDASATGLIFLCISSWIMWYELRKRYPYGLLVLGLGFAGVIFLIFILRLI
jgi:hypothetical protein